MTGGSFWFWTTWLAIGWHNRSSFRVIVKHLLGPDEPPKSRRRCDVPPRLPSSPVRVVRETSVFDWREWEEA